MMEENSRRYSVIYYDDMGDIPEPKDKSGYFDSRGKWVEGKFKNKSTKNVLTPLQVGKHLMRSQHQAHQAAWVLCQTTIGRIKPCLEEAIDESEGIGINVAVEKVGNVISVYTWGWNKHIFDTIYKRIVGVKALGELGT